MIVSNSTREMVCNRTERKKIPLTSKVGIYALLLWNYQYS